MPPRNGVSSRKMPTIAILRPAARCPAESILIFDCFFLNRIVPTELRVVLRDMQADDESPSCDRAMLTATGASCIQPHSQRASGMADNRRYVPCATPRSSGLPRCSERRRAYWCSPTAFPEQLGLFPAGGYHVA